MCVEENGLIREAARTNQQSVTADAGLRINAENELNEEWGVGVGGCIPIFIFLIWKQRNKGPFSGDSNTARRRRKRSKRWRWQKKRRWQRLPFIPREARSYQRRRWAPPRSANKRVGRVVGVKYWLRFWHGRRGWSPQISRWNACANTSASSSCSCSPLLETQQPQK